MTKKYKQRTLVRWKFKEEYTHSIVIQVDNVTLKDNWYGIIMEYDKALREWYTINKYGKEATAALLDVKIVYDEDKERVTYGPVYFKTKEDANNYNNKLRENENERNIK